MRKTLSIVLIFVGIFLITIAVLAKFWAPNQVMRTPLDADSDTRLTGTATIYGPDGGVTTPVKAISLTRANSAKSTDNTVVFSSSSCLVKDVGNAPNCVTTDDPDKRLIAAGTEVFATDRRSAMAVNDPKVLPASATERSGLINKWPFDAEKKTYPYWDSVSDQEAKATYVGKSKIVGLNANEYQVEVVGAPIEIAAGVPGTYTSTKQIWVDPRTGSILKQAEKQERVLDNGDPVLNLDFAFTQKTIDKNVKAAQDATKLLDLVTKTVPIGAGVLGILIFGLGVWTKRRRETVETYGNRKTRAAEVVYVRS